MSLQSTTVSLAQALGSHNLKTQRVPAKGLNTGMKGVDLWQRPGPNPQLHNS